MIKLKLLQLLVEVKSIVFMKKTHTLEFKQKIKNMI